MPAASSSTGLRFAAIAAIAVGAIGTLLLQMKASQHSHSLLLRELFAVWGLAPFLALLWFNRSATAWPPARRNTLYLVTLIVAAASLAIYAAGNAGSLHLRPAAPFLMVPIACWIVIGAARLIAGKRGLTGR